MKHMKTILLRNRLLDQFISGCNVKSSFNAQGSRPSQPRKIFYSSKVKPPDMLSRWCQFLPTCIPASASSIQVMSEPSDLYNFLIDGIKNAKERVVLSSLYLGTGNMEVKLVEELDKSLKNNPKLNAHILLDYTRGSRGEHNSRTLLLPAIQKHGAGRLCLSLFHTPNLRGVLKNVLPDRFNELLGLQHIKLYIIDDTVLLSGANMSHDYFTNRHDRYIEIKDNPALCDYLSELVETVSKFSSQVNSSNKAKLHPECRGHPDHEVDRYCHFSNDLTRRFIERNQTNPTTVTLSDTYVYPLLQMGSFNIQHDYKALKLFLKALSSHDSVYLSTAYFNPLQEYIDIMVQQSDAKFSVLAASPQVNGFYRAAGVAGYIPNAYSYYERCFLRQIERNQARERITLHEYVRPDWTFHGKGLWFYPEYSEYPHMTMIGSSNYGYRSVHLDLEAQLIIKTTNTSLQQSLHNERTSTFEYSHSISRRHLYKKDRKFPIWTPLVAGFSRNYF